MRGRNNSPRKAPLQKGLVVYWVINRLLQKVAVSPREIKLICKSC